MFWSINNIDNYITNVKGECVITYSIQGFNPEEGTITKHEVSIDNGETFKAITPAGNDTGFSFKVDADEIMKRCYVRCEMTEKSSPQTDPDSQLNPQEPKVITQTSNMFTVQYVDPNANNVPEIMNIKVINQNESGTFEVQYSATDKDEKDVLKHFIKVDKEEYKEITPNNVNGVYSYVGVGLSKGTHICQIKVSDGKAETESVVFNIIIPDLVNTPPTISVVTVSDMSYTGLYKLTYEANDVDIVDNLVHKLKIDEGEFAQITPIYLKNKFIYSGNGLRIGTHTCQISISDGVNPDVLSSTFEIIIPEKVNLKVKEALFNAKADYDAKYKSVIDTINKVINDIKTIPDYSLETGNIEITTKFDEYTLSSVQFKDVMQKAIDSIATKKTDDSKELLNKEIGDLSNALGSLDNTMSDVFKDGILTEAEKITIRQELQRLSLEKADVDNQYNSLLERFNKVDLDRGNAGDEKKTWYSKSYNDLKNAYANYDKEYKSLLSVIDFILHKEGIIDSTDKAKLDSAFDNYAKAINEYSRQSNLAIEAIARNESENNEVFIEEFKAEYIRNNKENSATLEHLTQKDDSFEKEMSQIKQTAESISSTVSKQGTDIETQKTTITQLSNSITSKVEEGTFNSQITQLKNQISSKVSSGQIGSLIEQNPDSIIAGLETDGVLSTNVKITNRYVTVWNGYLACDHLTTPTGHHPIITLFDDKIRTEGDGNCAIDATYNNHKGIGDSIRLQFTNKTYIMVGGYQNDAGLEYRPEFKVFLQEGNYSSKNTFLVFRHHSGASYAGSPQVGLTFDENNLEVLATTQTPSNFVRFKAGRFYSKAQGYDCTLEARINSLHKRSLPAFASETENSPSTYQIINNQDSLNDIKIISKKENDSFYKINGDEGEEDKTLRAITYTGETISEVNSEKLRIVLNENTPKCLIDINEFGEKTVDLLSLGCLNSMGIKENNTKILSLENQINDLKAEIQNLKNGGTK